MAFDVSLHSTLKNTTQTSPFSVDPSLWLPSRHTVGLNLSVDDVTTDWTLSVCFLSHRFFTPPAATTRAHWHHLHQCWPRPMPSPAPPSLASALTLRLVAPRRRRGRASAAGPCDSPLSSASSCLSTPRLLPWRQRGAASGSSLRNRRNTAAIAKNTARCSTSGSSHLPELMTRWCVFLFPPPLCSIL